MKCPILVMPDLTRLVFASAERVRNPFPCICICILWYWILNQVQDDNKNKGFLIGVRGYLYSNFFTRYDDRMEQQNGADKITTIEDLAGMIQRNVVVDLIDIKSDISGVKGDISSIKGTVAEMRADHLQLEDKVDAIAGILVNVATKQDLEHMLEKTYHLAQITAEHNRMKKIIQDKLGVEV